MKNRVARVVVASLLVIGIGACSAASTGVGPTIGLKTAPAAAQICEDALLGGQLTANNQTGLGVKSADGQATPVEWPFGYSARSEVGGAALLDPAGKVVAREGDEITVGGGFGNQLWHACGGVTVARPAS